MQTPKIQSVLSGHFSNAKADTTNRGALFYDEIIENMPDAILITDDNFVVKNKNASFDRIFPDRINNIIGTDAVSFFKEKCFQYEETNLWLENSEKNDKNINAIYNEDLALLIKSTQIQNLYVITLRDNTQSARYNALINEEMTKSDHLLESILPPSLVKRVQDGEQNISFSVQSASILFLDIVSFTPWCASNTSQFVMSTLNALFKKLDAAVAKYPTIMKVKCIGDCYMAVGGIFSEVNQPMEHAKEVTSFGLDALDIIGEINSELGTSLEIRVGINSGGPLVAGVLGVGKPTFEILGPAINMAQQMEHHGVPMKVHICRSTYELIYGDSFSIKERGTVEVKQRSVVTYLVSR